LRCIFLALRLGPDPSFYFDFIRFVSRTRISRRIPQAGSFFLIQAREPILLGFVQFCKASFVSNLGATSGWHVDCDGKLARFVQFCQARPRNPARPLVRRIVRRLFGGLS